ncbi:hypothetical protein F9B85_10320 [Heliorestis acidaminivorans]|uniref:Uncharacterized protein n=1 Tax=Heliorestis acidaminivorans TaxID=553427 RepID=A0A6I0F0R6_9FIRM|nr:hypothetical protein [Heliorestis acidaminivorans]KAB2951944.1 hypothetical protein F9B85_10320 [Heliorestis acidaminivorans]
MLLYSNQRVYRVYRTLRSFKDLQVLLAYDGATGDPTRGKVYLINEICNPSFIRTTIEEMLSLRRHSTFSEFAEVFSLNSKLYVVFHYNKSSALQDFLAHHKLPFAKRVLLVQNLLSKLSAYTALPVSVQLASVDFENINVQNDMSVSFNFAMHPNHFHSTTSHNDVYIGIANLINELFSKEVHTKEGRSLQLIMEKCERSVYKSVPEILIDARQIDTSSRWDKTRKWFDKKRPLLQKVKTLTFTVVLVLLIFVVYTRFISRDAVQTVGEPPVINQLGEIHLLQEEGAGD